MKQESVKIVGVLVDRKQDIYMAKDGSEKSTNKAIVEFDDNGYKQTVEMTVFKDEVWQDVNNIEDGVLTTFVCGLSGYFHEASGRCFTNLKCWRIDDYRESSSAAPASRPTVAEPAAGSSDSDLPF